MKMRERLMTKRSVHSWRFTPVVLLLALLPAWAYAEAPTTKSSTTSVGLKPAFKPGSPEEAVAILLNIGLKY